METKIDGKRMERIKRKCGFENEIDVGAEGSRGGISMAWKAGITIRLNNFSKNHIDVLVKENNVNQEWRFTGFYGSHYVTNKDDSWNLLRRLGQNQNHPWLIGLTRWARSIKKGRDGLKNKLMKELEEFLASDRDDDIMAKLIDTRIQLNMKIDKDEMLETEDGRDISGETAINEAASNYFQNLFSSQGIGSLSHLLKGKNVEKFCLGILSDGGDLDSLNLTDIVLIPKLPNPTSLVNFRPISLCTVLYKIVAKAIANRLQEVIGRCIDKAQSAFIPGRLITDNVLVTYELLHTLRQKLEWVNLIMKCISTVSYTVNINGRRGDVFKPTRGLRQGNLLSPFLLLICNERLLSLIRMSTIEGSMKGVRASKRGSEISHLLFADDYILFSETTHKGTRILKEILTEYEQCLGQCVNFGKSTIFYSSKTTERYKEETSSLLGARCSTNLEKYLGLPNVVSRRKEDAFQNLKDKVKLIIDNWSTRLLSQGVREAFIKSVLQAIPSYAMSCFLLPKSLCGGKKVGTGTSIYINADAWIPDVVNFKLSSVVNSMQDVKVDALINSNERIWKRDLINNIFSTDDARKILRIPLARTPHDDLLVWGGKYSEIRSSAKRKETIKWSYPPREFVKINFDGAYDTTYHKSASGVVVRNEEGLVLFSCSEIHHGVFSAFATEAIACRKAVQVGVELQWQKMIIDGDSLTIIKKYATKSQDRSHIRAYIHDIKQSLSRSSSFIFKHTLRSANALAHIIATETLKREEETYMEMGVPEYAEVQQRMDRREPD
ncbi:hypothetical protein PVK06_031045 [Gossypium arboreum]|uniref:Reverse transcriptase domain-containing protein n=1 Tax=Gossypium arboreum TaxID=29729 RepID=A0ABR0NQ71_GOSAR|nr:hypothetical protein PVK06_031045 [Gossypium arboreum]